MEENLLEKVLKETGYVKIMSEDVLDEKETPEHTRKKSMFTWEDPKTGEIRKSPLERACFKLDMIGEE